MPQPANAEGLKLTRNQSLVLSVLEQSRRPLSAYGILDRLRDEGLKAPLQVYRALDKLLNIGKVHRLESMNAFVICGHAGRGRGHPAITAFEICESCGRVTEFHDEKVERRLLRRTKEHGFKLKHTTIEIRGRCGACHNQSALDCIRHP